MHEAYAGSSGGGLTLPAAAAAAAAAPPAAGTHIDCQTTAQLAQILHKIHQLITIDCLPSCSQDVSIGQTLIAILLRI